MWSRLVLKLASLILPRAAKVWLKLDGKKTVTGIVGLVIGVAMCLYPPTVDEGVGVIITSVPVIMTGIWHKLYKLHSKRKELSK